MRFYVPNMEEPEEKEDADNEEKMKDENENKDDDQEPEEDEVTPAKVFNDQILKFAGLGDSAGDIIASFHDLPL